MNDYWCNLIELLRLQEMTPGEVKHYQRSALLATRLKTEEDAWQVAWAKRRKGEVKKNSQEMSR